MNKSVASRIIVIGCVWRKRSTTTMAQGEERRDVRDCDQENPWHREIRGEVGVFVLLFSFFLFYK